MYLEATKKVQEHSSFSFGTFSEKSSFHREVVLLSGPDNGRNKSLNSTLLKHGEEIWSVVTLDS